MNDWHSSWQAKHTTSSSQSKADSMHRVRLSCRQSNGSLSTFSLCSGSNPSTVSAVFEMEILNRSTKIQLEAYQSFEIATRRMLPKLSQKSELLFGCLQNHRLLRPVAAQGAAPGTRRLRARRVTRASATSLGIRFSAV